MSERWEPQGSSQDWVSDSLVGPFARCQPSCQLSKSSVPGLKGFALNGSPSRAAATPIFHAAFMLIFANSGPARDHERGQVSRQEDEVSWNREPKISSGAAAARAQGLEASSPARLCGFAERSAAGDASTPCRRPDLGRAPAFRQDRR